MKQEKEILSLGFKKVWFEDKSGHWFEKPFNYIPFKCKAVIDDPTSCYMEIEVLRDKINGKYNKSFEIFWTGNYSQLKKKLKKYEETNLFIATIDNLK